MARLYDEFVNLCDCCAYTTDSGGLSSPSEFGASLYGNATIKYLVTANRFQANVVSAPQESILDQIDRAANYSELNRCPYYWGKLMTRIDKKIVYGFEFNLFADKDVRSRPWHPQSLEKMFHIITSDHQYIPSEVTVHDALKEYVKMINLMKQHKNDNIASKGFIASPEIFLHTVGQYSSSVRDKELDEYFIDLIDLCNECMVPIEVNEAAIRSYDIDWISKPLLSKWLMIAKSRKAYIIVNSGTRVAYNIGRVPQALNILEAMKYPIDRIINFDESKVRHFLFI